MPCCWRYHGDGMATEVNERTIWQVSAGPADRSYADRFLEHGVALIGPGDTGPWRSERSDEEFEGGFVRRFAAELRGRGHTAASDGSVDHSCGWPGCIGLPVPTAIRRCKWVGPTARPAHALVCASGAVRSRQPGVRRQPASALTYSGRGNCQVRESGCSVTTHGLASARPAEPTGGGTDTRDATARIAGARGSGT